MKQKWQMQSSAQNSDWKYADRQKKKRKKQSSIKRKQYVK